MIDQQADSVLAQVLDSLPMAVYVVDADGKPYYANSASQELLGQGIAPGATPDQLAEIYHVYITGTDKPYPTDNIPVVRALRGETGEVMDMDIRRPDKTVQLQLWYKPVYDQNHSIIYGVVAFRDVSAEVVALAEREALEKARLERKHNKA